MAWSPTDNQILARSEGSSPVLFLVTPDFKNERLLTSRVFIPDAVGFSNDGRAVLGLLHNTSGTGLPWQLWSIDVTTGREARLFEVHLPEATNRVSGFSLHPDGTRFLTSIMTFPRNIWMLEGFE
jgi:sugar lactone lactonase YvrE